MNSIVSCFLARIGVPILCLAGLAGCGGPNTPPSSQSGGQPTASPTAATTGQADPARPIRVLATTTLIADVVRAVGGPRVEVTTLIGPGLDPHLYKARESDLRKLTEAELVFFHGLGLEARMGEVLRQHHSSLGDSVAVAEVIPEAKLRSKGEGQSALDPHVWMDPDLWVLTADVVAKTLSGVDQTHASAYGDRAKKWVAEVRTMQTAVRTKYESIPQAQRVLVTAHDAFGYLGAAFGLEVRGLQGISTAAEAGAADVDALAQFLVDRKISTVFAESSVPTRGLEALMEAVKSRGGQLRIGEELLSDSLAAPDQPGGTYVGMMVQNAQRITEGLGGLPAPRP